MFSRHKTVFVMMNKNCMLCVCMYYILILRPQIIRSMEILQTEQISDKNREAYNKRIKKVSRRTFKKS